MKKLLLALFSILCYLSVDAQCVASLTINNGACDSTCSAIISVQLTGNAMPLTITLSDGTNTYGPFQATSFWQYGNLCPGNYQLTVIDANGDTCTGTTTFPILNLQGPTADVIVTNATCSTCGDGAATANVIGGTPPYIYQWSNGISGGGSIGGLMPGWYTLWVVDANGCGDLDTFVIGVGINNGYLITGQTYFDTNNNGIKDGGEPGLGNKQVEMTPGNITAVTNLNGDYAFAVLPGTYDITYIAQPGWTLTSTPSVYNTTITGANSTNNDFGLYPDSTYGEASVTLHSGLPRCLWNIPYYLTVHNNGFTMLDGTMLFTYDPAHTFIASSVAPLSHVGNVMTFSFSNLAPGNSYPISVTLLEPAGGTAISSQLDVSGSDAFGYQFSLNSTLAQVVTCSYDPNDKAVLPAGIGGGNYVAMDTWLDYMIRFQNTGTDTAFAVVIVDTISAGLDMNTFTLIGSSHPVNVTTHNGNEVAFSFDNILLPDSNINESASHGYVMYRIKGNDNNPDPTVIENTAYIYFDQNSPVETNTTLTTFSDNFLSIAETNGTNLFELFPNPMHDVAVLRVKTPSPSVYTITISDIQGRVVQGPDKMKDGMMIIQNPNLNPGTYIIEAKPDDNEKSSFLRLVKNH